MKGTITKAEFIERIKDYPGDTPILVLLDGDHYARKITEIDFNLMHESKAHGLLIDNAETGGETTKCITLVIGRADTGE